MWTMRVASVGPLVVGGVVLSACGQIIGIGDLSTASSDAQAPTTAVDAGGAVDVGVLRDAVSTTEAGPNDKRVFVTSDTSNGLIGGLAGADARCMTAAGRGKLGGTWVAWLSGEGKNAIDRVTYGGAYRLLNGNLVVARKSELTAGALTAAINRTELDELVTAPFLVWTGTRQTGTAGVTCANWSTADFYTLGTLGNLESSSTAGWTDNGGPGGGFRDTGCQVASRLYCFEL
jgi:hypothetical protein